MVNEWCHVRAEVVLFLTTWTLPIVVNWSRGDGA
jgi:hypothetical protein